MEPGYGDMLLGPNANILVVGNVIYLPQHPVSMDD